MIDCINPATCCDSAAIYCGIIYPGGQVPEDGGTDAAAPDGNVLAHCSPGKAQAFETAICLTGFTDYVAVNAVWHAWTMPERAPAHACIQVKLANPRWKMANRLRVQK